MKGVGWMGTWQLSRVEGLGVGGELPEERVFERGGQLRGQAVGGSLARRRVPDEEDAGGHRLFEVEQTLHAGADHSPEKKDKQQLEPFQRRRALLDE